MRLRPLFAILLLGVLPACGGGKDSVTPKVAETQPAIDADPVALLPSGAMVIAKVDTKAMFTAGSVGGQVTLLAERMMPVGEEAGFKASRDLESAIVASYTLQGADLAAVLTGAFDEQKIARAAETHTPTKAGGVLVASDYGGRRVYSVNNVGFTVLTPKTVVAGTETMIRRAIERIKDGRLERDQVPWMLQTIETPNAAFAGAADFANQPIGAASVGMIPIGWLKGLKAVRLIGNFKDPGLNIAATLTYPDVNVARDSADQVKRTAGMANLFTVFGAPQLRNVDIKTQESDVQVTFAVDDQSLRTFLGSMQHYLTAK